MLLVTLGGLFVVSALIGVIATGLDSRIEELRKGRSVVLEEDHTLILGWSDTIFTVLSELEIANESQKRPSAVVLADRDKVEMDDLIREKVRPKRTRVVTRSGSPIDLGHLALVRPEKARSIIVLAPEGDERARRPGDQGGPGADQGHAATRPRVPHRRRDPRPRQPRAPPLVGGDEAVLIDKRETIAKLVVHAARQSGASAAFIELLDFKGDEIYFREDPSLVGRPFAEALLAYEDCSAIGADRRRREGDAQPAGRARHRRRRAADRDRRGRRRGCQRRRPRVGEVEEDAIVSAPPPSAGPERDPRARAGTAARRR